MAARSFRNGRKKLRRAPARLPDTLLVSCARGLNAVGRLEAANHVIYGEARHWSSADAPIKLAFGSIPNDSLLETYSPSYRAHKALLTHSA